MDTRTHGENSDETSVSAESPGDLCGSPEVISTDLLKVQQTRKLGKRVRRKKQSSKGMQVSSMCTFWKTAGCESI